MLDRKVAPAFKPVQLVHIPEIFSAELANGRKVFYRQDETIEVFKVDLVIQSGSWFADQYSYISLALKVLNEGTRSKNSHQLAEAIDFIGSFAEFTPGFDQSHLSFYGLSRFYEENINLLSEIIYDPSFDEDQFSLLKNKELEKLKLNLEKGSYLSSVALRKMLFGSNHPYGRFNTIEEFEKVSLIEIQRFFSTNFCDFDILITGKLPDNFLTLLEARFGQGPLLKAGSKPQRISPENIRYVEERKSSFIQSSIKIGKQLFNRTHPDYMKFIVMNELLGGFFGSRLMKNIREDKGFTYGIYSHLYSLNHAGYFSIGTDVNGENEQQTLDEIHREIVLLQQQTVSKDELETVKNYMAGSFAGSLNSPFALMDKFKAVHYQGLTMDFYSNYLPTIYEVTATDLQAMANQYLQVDSLYTAVAGPLR